MSQGATPPPAPAPAAPTPQPVGFGGAPGMTPELVQHVKDYLADPNTPEDNKRRLLDTVKAKYFKQPTVEGGAGAPVTQLAPEGLAGGITASPPGAGITRAIVAGAPAVASTVAPFAIPEIAGAGMALRVGLAAARSLAAAGAGVGAQVGVRKVAGLAPPTSFEMAEEALTSLGPQILDEALKPIMLAGRESMQLEEAITGRKATLESAEGLHARAVARKQEAQAAAESAKIAGAETKGTRASEIRNLEDEARAQLQNLPSTLAGSSRTSAHRLGSTMQDDLLRGMQHTEAKKRALYQAEVDEAKRLKLRAPVAPGLLDDVTTLLTNLDSTGIPEAQSASLKKILGGFVDKVAPKFDTETGIVRAPVSLDYAEWDGLRRDLQKFVRTPGGKARSFDKGTLERVYAGVKDVMDTAAAGTSVERLAKKADLFFRYQVMPVRDAVLSGALNKQQPSAIAHSLFTHGNADRLGKVMKLLPEGTATKLRAALQEDMLEAATTTSPSGFKRLSPYKYLDNWDALTPTQKRAIGGGPGNAVETAVEGVRGILNRTVTSEANVQRQVLAARKELQAARAQLTAAKEAAVAARGALTAAEEAAQRAGETRLTKIENMLHLGAAGAGIYELSKGNIYTGFGLLMGTAAGHRALAYVLASPRSARVFNKMIATAGRVRPGSAEAVRMASNFLGHIGIDILNNGIGREDEAAAEAQASQP